MHNNKLFFLRTGKDSKRVHAHQNFVHKNHPHTSQSSPPSSSPVSQPSAPPPVTYEPSPPETSSKNSTSSNYSAVTSPKTPNGENPSDLLTSPIAGSSGSTANFGIYFSPSISGDARLPPAGDAVRDRCRELLVKAMMKGYEKGEEAKEVSVYVRCT